MKTDIKETEKNTLSTLKCPVLKERHRAEFRKRILDDFRQKRRLPRTARVIFAKERAMSCSRSFYMGDVDEKQIKAKYENGVLLVTVPKERKEESKHAISID